MKHKILFLLVWVSINLNAQTQSELAAKITTGNSSVNYVGNIITNQSIQIGNYRIYYVASSTNLEIATVNAGTYSVDYYMKRNIAGTQTEASGILTVTSTQQTFGTALTVSGETRTYIFMDAGANKFYELLILKSTSAIGMYLKLLQ